MKIVSFARQMPLTLVLIVLSTLLTGVSSFGVNRHVLLPFYISEYTGGGMREVFHGQVWRLVMPIFMHFGPFHFLFNMLWLFELGSILERVQGTVRFSALVALAALVGNVAQYFWAGPYFGGMSGVTFCLLGYVWMHDKHYPKRDVRPHAFILVMMLVWFVICWSGVIANANNMAHTTGLVVGLLMGWLLPPAKRART